MPESIPEQLRDFDGGALSSDFGPVLPQGVDQQIGLSHRLAEAFDDQRHPSNTNINSKHLCKENSCNPLV